MVFLIYVYKLVSAADTFSHWRRLRIVLAQKILMQDEEISARGSGAYLHT